MPRGRSQSSRLVLLTGVNDVMITGAEAQEKGTTTCASASTWPQHCYWYVPAQTPGTPYTSGVGLPCTYTGIPTCKCTHWMSWILLPPTLIISMVDSGAFFFFGGGGKRVCFLHMPPAHVLRGVCVGVTACNCECFLVLCRYPFYAVDSDKAFTGHWRRELFCSALGCLCL
jgi:hypothetical protein